MKRRKSAGEIFQEQLIAKQEQTLTKEDNLLLDDCERLDRVEDSSLRREIDLREDPALDIEQLNLELEELSRLDIKDIPPPPEVISIGRSLDKDIPVGSSFKDIPMGNSFEENFLEDEPPEYEKKQATKISNFFSSDISSLGEDQAEPPMERKKTFLPDPSLPQLFGVQNSMSDHNKLVTSEELQLEKEPIQVRETGFRFWKRVIVPPNAYVVHTRLGHKEPITLGLGMSFRYNPAKDAYFVVPAVMQTIGIVANCMTREKQGINLLAYLQWRIDNFAIAYRKLDFSNPRDPLGVVNAQLREQAEATIKDKISTMGVEEVLTDKSPIIEELTTRLKEVTEGRTQDKEVAGEGLGIKIVTVQIREALVSSKSLWQNLQAPYRHQQEKIARISLLMTQNEVRQKEQESRQYTETSQAEMTLAIERIKQTKQTEVMTLKLAEEIIRSTKEQETQLKKIQLDEQVHFVQQESKQRLEIQMRKIEQEKELIALQREHAKILEQTKLDMERQAQQKTLHTEQMLHTLTEESRLAEMMRQTQREKLEKERTLRQEIASFKLFLQEQKNLIAAKEQEALLSHQRRAHLSQLELDKETEQFKAMQQEREIALERLVQEARNVISESDLKRRLIEVLPQLFAEMPEIHELKILQMQEGHVTFDMFIAFLANILAMIENWDTKWVATTTDSL